MLNCDIKKFQYMIKIAKLKKQINLQNRYFYGSLASLTRGGFVWGIMGILRRKVYYYNYSLINN